jgi:radical SAM superfamily enzyme YgiQ (UPF0313 family)
MNTPHILLVNPWVHDFAAYDFWAKPLGLLTLGGILREHGARVSYLDCLDRFHPMSAAVSAPVTRNGRGSYLKTPIPKPPGLEDIPRNFCRYGIPPEWFANDLRRLHPPDLVLVTSLMTYWYPGVREAIGVIKSVFPEVPVILGGIYATLCSDHARRVCGADRVVTGAGEAAILPLVAELTGWSPPIRIDPRDLDTLPRPVLDLEHRLVHAPVLTSRGCPLRCAYCASHRLQPRRMQRSPAAVVDEIKFWHEQCAVSDFAIYDDAFLLHADEHAMPILEAIIAVQMDIRLHTPNALHIREITLPVAELMVRAGFHTIRLGLETTAFDHRDHLDRKVNAAQFLRSVNHLKTAGFRADQVGAYLLSGLPGQTVADVAQSIDVVKRAGITPVIAHYTPIPHTPMWPEAVAASRYDLEADPIFTNNALFPCQSEAFSWKALSHLKRIARC